MQGVHQQQMHADARKKPERDGPGPAEVRSERVHAAACPMSATPAALPIDSKDPPTPVVNVTSSHSRCVMLGDICRTANMTGTLSTSAESKPTRTFRGRRTQMDVQ